LPVGKVTFNLLFKLIKISDLLSNGSSTNVSTYSIAIWFLNDFAEENSNGKGSPQKIPIEL